MQPQAGFRPRSRGLLRELATVIAVAAAYLLAYEVRFEFQVPADFRSTALTTLPLVVALQFGLLRVLGVQRHSWQFTSLWDVVAITGAMLVSSVLLVTLRFALPPLAALVDVEITTVVPLGVIAADLALSVLALVGVRALRRLQVEQRDVRRRRQVGNGANGRTQRVVIIGAGRAGRAVAATAGSDRRPSARPDPPLRPGTW